MNVLEIPLNKLIGIKKAEKDEFIFKVEAKHEHLNHLGTVHAAILFTLAEASSGEFLWQEFKEYNISTIPVVRKVEVKYSKPGNGDVFSRATYFNSSTEEIYEVLKNRKRVIIKVKVEIFNQQDEKLMSSVFDWFVTLL